MGRGWVGDTALPSKSHEGGVFGTRASFRLELKAVADVGLVGQPNAGKSTVLTALTRAQPKIASYAFTTLHPQLEMVHYSDWSSISVADIPGLIEGAHENRGLGHAFLRHIERTRALVYVVDMAPAAEQARPWEVFTQLREELEAYRAGLAGKPAIIVANKMDEPSAEANLEEFRRRVGGEMVVVPMCAVLGEGLEELREALRILVTPANGERGSGEGGHIRDITKLETEQ